MEGGKESKNTPSINSAYPRVVTITSAEMLTSAWLHLSKGQDENNCSSPWNSRFYYFLLITTIDFLSVTTQNVVLNHISLKM